MFSRWWWKPFSGKNLLNMLNSRWQKIITIMIMISGKNPLNFGEFSLAKNSVVFDKRRQNILRNILFMVSRNRRWWWWWSNDDEQNIYSIQRHKWLFYEQHSIIWWHHDDKMQWRDIPCWKLRINVCIRNFHSHKCLFYEQQPTEQKPRPKAIYLNVSFHSITFSQKVSLPQRFTNPCQNYPDQTYKRS